MYQISEGKGLVFSALPFSLYKGENRLCNVPKVSKQWRRPLKFSLCDIRHRVVSLFFVERDQRASLNSLIL